MNISMEANSANTGYGQEDWGGTANSVDWESVRRAMMEVGWQRCKWVTKLAKGDFAHGENMR